MNTEMAQFINWLQKLSLIGTKLMLHCPETNFLVTELDWHLKLTIISFLSGTLKNLFSSTRSLLPVTLKNFKKSTVKARLDEQTGTI